MKIRFQADANLDPDIGLGLQRRDPSIDYRLALGVIPDGMLDPDVLGLAILDRRGDAKPDPMVAALTQG